ncbi:MAG: restriction endonuclease subunit S, partial [Aeriscardovia sp.]|nr:restriction endonuclease subunit S [Aeriscardovia sp.]
MSRLSELIAELCPDGVKYMRFDEACTLKARIGWQRLTKSEQMPTGEYMLITGTDFTDKHTIDFDHCCYVSKDRFDQDLNIQVRNGDLLVTKDGTLGKVAIVEGLDMPATLNGGVFVVRDKTGLFDHRFIMHYLLSDHFRRLMLMQSTGSTISHLTQKLFSRLKLPVPPLPVQEEIVRILDSFSSL